MAKLCLHLMGKEEERVDSGWKEDRVVCGSRGRSGKSNFTQDLNQATCQKCLRIHSYLLKARTEPPPEAQRVYAQGVLACEERGLPLSCLRIQYLLKFGMLYYGSWWWDGVTWLRVEPGEKVPFQVNGESTRTHRWGCADKGGIWFAFDSLDEAKMVGLIKPRSSKKTLGLYDEAATGF
jgi:hypothetical protein